MIKTKQMVPRWRKYLLVPAIRKHPLPY